MGVILTIHWEAADNTDAGAVNIATGKLIHEHAVAKFGEQAVRPQNAEFILETTTSIAVKVFTRGGCGTCGDVTKPATAALCRFADRFIIADNLGDESESEPENWIAIPNLKRIHYTIASADANEMRN
jgi:hypothetical protein